MAFVSGIKFNVAKHNAKPIVRSDTARRNVESVLLAVLEPWSAKTDGGKYEIFKGELVILIAKSKGTAYLKQNYSSYRQGERPRH